MITAILAFTSFFAFGYCVTDLVMNRRSAKRLDEMLKEIEDMQKK